MADDPPVMVDDPQAILCFGDSNTWGSDPADDERRFPWPVRWPGVLQRLLGGGVHVVRACCNACWAAASTSSRRGSAAVRR
jgi:hypothetical protein